VKIGKIYNGKVVSIKDFGAFVEIAPETDGLCHVSELSEHYVQNVMDVVNIGDDIQVKVIHIDDQGRIKLSRKAALKELGITEPEPVGAPAGGPDEGEGDRHHDRGEGGQRGEFRGGRGGPHGDRGNRGGGGGEHRGGGGGGGRGGRGGDRGRGPRPERHED